MPRTGDLARRLAVARGDEPADLVVRGGRVLSVFTREWLDADVAICDGMIAGVGAYEGLETLDAAGAYVVPGFVDAHMHLETSKLLPSEFARLVLPLGTTAVVADPHEIANVLGTDGVHWLVDACDGLPLDVYFTASSCVPASRFESPRRPFTPGDLESLLRRRRVIGLAEMMNFPGVIAGEESELAKLAVAGTHHVDGHAPGVLGRALQAYAAAGIRSDHEAFTAEEGRERLRAGMWLLIRQASAARNLRALAPLVVELGPSRMAFCTDDREPEHIAEDGHINAIVRDAVAYGIAPEDALVLASHHPALWHGLDTLGAIAPGYQADLLLLPDLELFVPEVVLKRGRAVDQIPVTAVPEWVTQSVRVRSVVPGDFRLDWAGGRARVIGLVPGQIVTESLVEELPEAVADASRDLAKIAVIERHLGTGRTGLGFVRGFGLGRGAFGSTFSHDAHNLIVVGMSDDEMARAAERLVEIGGGLVVVDDGRVTAELPLPVAGLISDRSLADVIEASAATVAAVQALGSTVESPFQVLAFLALSVIPSLKITDHGLVDVDRFQLVPLAADIAVPAS
ncbi:MAG: adenine deaminase [Gaiellaceae bacterium]|jgi:adenine deaminase|nr:adenine deaminase [Gaiellaceae bacterium]